MHLKTVATTLALTFWQMPLVFAQDEYLASALSVHEKVDAFFVGPDQLTIERKRSPVHDRAHHTNSKSTFSAVIGQEVFDAAQKRSADLNSWYLRTFNIPIDHISEKVSLLDAPMCTHTHDDMKKLLKSGRLVTDSELQQINQFVSIHNEGQLAAVNNGASPTSVRHWNALMGCLAYTESLGDPDTATSIKRSKTLLGRDYTKEPGVKFYYDPRHSNRESRWNVGLYQFVLKTGGNINPCVRGWNLSRHTDAKVPIRGDIKDVAKFMASGGQTLNAYCGVHKILETLFVQKFTDNPTRTHPSNFSGGKLARPEDRCVSIHASRAYMHFGPFVRTDGSQRNGFTSNLDKLLQCTLKALED